jgi:hypothetical protein
LSQRCHIRCAGPVGGAASSARWKATISAWRTRHRIACPDGPVGAGPVVVVDPVVVVVAFVVVVVDAPVVVVVDDAVVVVVVDPVVVVVDPVVVVVEPVVVVVVELCVTAQWICAGLSCGSAVTVS